MKSIYLFFSTFNSGKLGALSIAMTTIILNSQMQLILLSILIGIDFITGVKKSFKVKKIKPNPFKKSFWGVVHSKGMRETWNKGYQYGIGILVMVAVQAIFFGKSHFHILNQDFSIVKAGMLILCAIEIYSIFENLKVGNSSLINKMENLIIRIVQVFKGNKTK